MASRFAFAVVLVLVRAGARAQTTSAVCSSDFVWAVNNLNQSPCLVAAYLLLPCTPGGGNVGALPSAGLSYITPSLSGGSLVANQCTCSTVTYSAIQACALCQGGKSVAWSAWRANCTDAQTSIGTYPEEVESSTLIPRWMFDDVEKSDAFDAPAAEQVAASALPDASVGAPPGPATSAVGPTSGLGSKTDVGPAAKSGHAAVPLFAIVAAAVGGLAVLLIIAIVTTCLVRRSRRRRGGHARGKSLEGMVIGKPVPRSPIVPNSASSFGPPGPAPWPTASPGSTGAGAGWPQGASSPRSRGPPSEIAVLGPDGGQSWSSSALPPSLQTGPPSTQGGVVRQATPGPQGSPRSIAGPPPRDVHNPADPRTWPPSGPPPRKVQGLPVSPRQQRAQRVASQDAPDGVARYPSPQPQLGAAPPLQTQASIETLRNAGTQPLAVPARYPSPIATVTTRPTPTHTPSTSQSGQSLSRFAHSPSASQSGRDRFVHSPSSSQSGAGRFAHSPSSSQSGPGRVVPSPGPIVTAGPTPSAARYAHSPSSSASHSPYDAALSPASSTAPLRYPSPSETMAVERDSGRYANHSPFPSLDAGAQRLTVAAQPVGPSRRR